MSLNLKDLVNFGEGMILRDREKTDQKFAIHNANLQANRDQLIKMKDKKFDRDIKRYDEEKTKYDRIKSANAQFGKTQFCLDICLQCSKINGNIPILHFDNGEIR